MAKPNPKGAKAAAPSAGQSEDWDPAVEQTDMFGDPDPTADPHQPDDQEAAIHGERQYGAHVTDDFDQNHEGQPAEPERVFDQPAWDEDTDNTHQDGGNGWHQEHYISADDLARLPENQPGGIEAAVHRHRQEPASLLPGDIARRINDRSPSLTHSILAPANRDETIVGKQPLFEKGLRPPAPLDGVQRTDDAGRPFQGGYLHTEDKGYPPGMGVTEHVPAPTASGTAPEGLQAVIAPLPMLGHSRDPKRIERRHERVGQELTDRHHAMIDSAEDLKRKGAEEFTLAQAGGTGYTAKELVELGVLSEREATSGYFFPDSGKVYSLND